MEFRAFTARDKPNSSAGQPATRHLAAPSVAESRERAEKAWGRITRFDSILRGTRRPVPVFRSGCFADSRVVRPRLARIALSLDIRLPAAGGTGTGGFARTGSGTSRATCAVPRTRAPMVGQCGRASELSRRLAGRSDGKLSGASL